MKTVLIMSGGLDSSVLCAVLKNDGHQVLGLSFDYGQRHKKELAAAGEIAKHIGTDDWRVVDLTSVTPLIATSSQTNPDIEVPDGHYAEDTMKATVVPNRNMIMLSVAIGAAIAARYTQVALGVHAGDHTIYPDCRPEFVGAMNHAASLAHFTPVNVLAPFARLTKSEIVKLGTKLNVPFAMTWSCYRDGERHCGRCGTCVERREAFTLAGVDDPTTYEEAPNVDDHEAV